MKRLLILSPSTSPRSEMFHSLGREGLRLQGSAAQDWDFGESWQKQFTNNEGRWRGMPPQKLRSDLDVVRLAQGT